MRHIVTGFTCDQQGLIHKLGTLNKTVSDKVDGFICGMSVRKETRKTENIKRQPLISNNENKKRAGLV
jgi:hypothetical protein